MDKLIEILTGILTINGIIIMSVVFGMTELIKQILKHNKKSLNNFQIRIVSIIIGLAVSIIMLDSYPLEKQIIYGLFYSFAAPVVYYIVKRYIIKNLSEDLSNKLSGQQDNKGEYYG